MTSRLKQAEKLKLKTIENEPQKVQPPKIMTTVEKTKNILAAIQDKLIHDLDEHTIIIPNHKVNILLSRYHSKSRMKMKRMNNKSKGG